MKLIAFSSLIISFFIVGCQKNSSSPESPTNSANSNYIEKLQEEKNRIQRQDSDIALSCKFESKIGMPPSIEGENFIFMYSPTNDLKLFGAVNSDNTLVPTIKINEKVHETVDEYMYAIDGPSSTLSDEVEKLTVDRKSLKVVYSHHGGFRGTGYIYYDCNLLDDNSYQNIIKAHIYSKNSSIQLNKI